MVHSPDTPRLSTQAPTSTSTPQPLSRCNVRQHTKSVTLLPKIPTTTRPLSLEWASLCQDKNYPCKPSKLLRPIQKAYAPLTTPVHWRGNGHTLFKLDPAAKCNIRDYLAEQCIARKQTTNELTKPTGIKLVFVLQLHGELGEQEALCVQTNDVTLHRIYDFCDADSNDIRIKHPKPSVLSTKNMQNGATRRLPRSRGTASLARIMARTNEEGFPLADRELDSDSDDKDQHGSATASYIAVFDAITEGDEEQETNDGFVDVVDHGAPKYCRDPHYAGHPECHGRYKTGSYVHSVVDAELDFQERFAAVQHGGDSAAHYCNWRNLKLDFGETMVHGESALRNMVALNSDERETIDPTEQLLLLIDAKYGPLTLAGQKSNVLASKTKCSEECNSKVSEYLDQNLVNDPWLSDRPIVDENQELVSEPSTLFDGVADLSDEDAPAPAPATAGSQTANAPSMSEEALEKILNTSHEDFINHYVQRQQALREKAAHAKQIRNATEHFSVVAGSTNETPKRDDANNSLLLADSTAESTVVTVDSAMEEIMAPPDLIVTVPTPATSPIEDISPLVLPVFIGNEAALVDASIRPVSASSSRSSREGSSLHTSVFSRQASVTTKPSNESFGSDYLRLVDTLDLQVAVKLAPVPVSLHDRAVSMPSLSFPTPDTSKTSNHVSEPDHVADAQYTYVVPSTPVRVTTAGNKFLTPIIEVQTPIESRPKRSATMHGGIIIHDLDQSSVVTLKEEQYDLDDSSEATLQKVEGRQETSILQDHTSLSTHDLPPTSRRQRCNKLTAKMKHRAQVAANATKQATRRVLYSAKKLRAVARYFVSATTVTYDPYKVIARK